MRPPQAEGARKIVKAGKWAHFRSSQWGLERVNRGPSEVHTPRLRRKRPDGDHTLTTRRGGNTVTA